MFEAAREGRFFLFLFAGYMFTVADFVSKYHNYTDNELFEMHTTIYEYGSEAKEALSIVIEKRGGIEKLKRQIEQEELIKAEINKISEEVEKLGLENVDLSLIKTITKSGLLSDEQLEDVIEHKYKEIHEVLEDKKIKPRTIIGSLIGGLISSITGGILWGLQMIYSGRVFHIFLVGLALLCYGAIKFSTKQTKKNTVVIIATVISVLLALLIGQLLYNIIGNRHSG